jgi:diadenosine tetraphosphate (Ap4A) HIT family hydrolase
MHLRPILASSAALAVIGCVSLSRPPEGLQRTETPSGLPGLCTQIPDLYSRWKRSVVGADASDAVLAAAVAAAKRRVDSLPEVFPRFVTEDSAKLTAAGERRLWLDDSLFVLVDRLSLSPELLVIPRANVSFLTQVSPGLRQRMAVVAAAAYDALQAAANRPCARAAPTSVWIGAPRGLTVRQLHVHVTPERPIVVSDLAAFYADVTRHLDVLLTQTR